MAYGINYNVDKRFQSPKYGINYEVDKRFQSPEPSKALSDDAKKRAADKEWALIRENEARIENDYKANNPKAPETPEAPGKTYGIGSIGMFNPSSQYNQMLANANSLLESLKSGRTSYTDQLNNIINQIQNREAFSYDMDNDALFQNALSSAMNSGQTAMQNTMGQAAALTGGYGSTYATSAANQAYNSYIQDAYNQLPDYYNLALDAYNMEGQRLNNQASLLQSADESEYSRLLNSYQAQADAANNLYNQEYSNYWQTANYNQNAAQFNAEMAYKKAMADRDQTNWQNEYDFKLQQYKDSLTGDTTPSYNKVRDYTNYIDALNSKYRPGTDEWNAEMANFANVNNLNLDEVISYANAFSPEIQYQLDGTGTKYVDNWGGDVDEVPTFRLDTSDKNRTSNDVYVDEHGNSHTKNWLESHGYTKKGNTYIPKN